VLDLGEPVAQSAPLDLADPGIGGEPGPALSGAGEPPAQPGQKDFGIPALSLILQEPAGVRITHGTDELAGQEQGQGLLKHVLRHF
jgi:hypothetical protein